MTPCVMGEDEALCSQQQGQLIAQPSQQQSRCCSCDSSTAATQQLDGSRTRQMREMRRDGQTFIRAGRKKQLLGRVRTPTPLASAYMYYVWRSGDKDSPLKGHTRALDSARGFGPACLLLEWILISWFGVGIGLRVLMTTACPSGWRGAVRDV